MDCLLQDRTGYLWVGTQNGLFRYDGVKFVGFFRTEGLPQAQVSGLAESPDGVLWVGTYAGGLAYRSGARFVPVGTGEKGLVVRALAFDSTGALYVEHESGLMRGVRDPSGTYRFRTLVRGAVSGLYIRGVDVWFAADGDLWNLVGDRAERTGSPAGLPKEAWKTAVEDAAGNLWVRSQEHLFMRARSAGRFVNRSEGIPACYDACPLDAGLDGRLLIGYNSGYVILDGPKRFMVDAEHGMPGLAVKSLLTGPDESLWIGLSGGGLARLAGRGEWLSWRREDGLPSNSIQAVHYDRAGRVWTGTDGGLSVLDPEGRVQRTWTRGGGLAGNSVFAVAEGPAGDVFASSDPSGLSHFSQQGKLLRTYGPKAGLNTSHIVAIGLDGDNRVWVVGSYKCFRSRSAARDGTRLQFEPVNIPGLPERSHFYGLRVDSAAAVWVSTSAGLARFDGKVWRIFTNRDGLRASGVQSLVERQGEYWVIYRDSLGITRFRFDGERLAVAHFTTLNGLSSDKAYSIAFDLVGRLWVGTDCGVEMWWQGHWHQQDVEDGLIWDDTNQGALEGDWKGNVWVGTSNGLSRYAPRSKRGADARPRIVLTAIEGESKSWGPSELPDLAYAKRSLRIRFSGLNFADETRSRFRYRLVAGSGMWGHDSAWKDTREHNVNFAALPAGRYTFEVMAGNRDGEWSQTPARLVFAIQPPWWQTWWFQLFCAFGLGVLAIAVWKFRVRALIAREQHLQSEVAARTAELQESHRNLEKMAYTDSLTGLPNRRAFIEQLNHRIAKTVLPGGEAFALLVLDLDRFKIVNDLHGHDAGDAVLMEASARLCASVRKPDCVARLGGDEFAILLANAPAPSEIEAVCEQIKNSFITGVRFRNALLETSPSIGIAVFPTHGGTQEGIYKSADLALYEAKRKGRNIHCWYGATVDVAGDLAAVGSKSTHGSVPV